MLSVVSHCTARPQYVENAAESLSILARNNIPPHTTVLTRSSAIHSAGVQSPISTSARHVLETTDIMEVSSGRHPVPGMATTMTGADNVCEQAILDTSKDIDIG